MNQKGSLGFSIHKSTRLIELAAWLPANRSRVGPLDPVSLLFFSRTPYTSPRSPTPYN